MQWLSSCMASLRIPEDFAHYLPKCTISCMQDTKSRKFLKRIHRIYVFFFSHEINSQLFYSSSDLAQANGSAHIWSRNLLNHGSPGTWYVYIIHKSSFQIVQYLTVVM